MSSIRSRMMSVPAIVTALRGAREAALRVAGPLDAAHRRLTGRGNLPPLWLRRHAGPVAGFERAPAEVAAIIALLGLIDSRSRVLDVGCGAGAMALEFDRMLGTGGQYVGFDVHEASVEWAARHFRGDPRFRFEHARLRTPYSSSERGDAVSYRFPVHDGSVTFVLTKSVYTHLLEPEAAHYLRETARVLGDGGRALVTAFLLDDDGAAPRRDAAPTIAFPHGGPHVWWMRAAHPHAGVAFTRTRFESMCAAAGLVVERLVPGYWSGLGVAPNYQDLLVLARA